MNTMIANPQIASDIFPPVVKGNLTPRQLWNAGYAAFIKRAPYGEMVTEYEKKGYDQAMRDCSFADTSEYLVKTGAAQ